MSKPVNHRWYWTLFLATIAILMVLINIYVQSLERQVKREGRASHTFVSARSVLIDMLDTETGLRGFLLAGHKEYLRPYHEAAGRLNSHIASLKATAVNNPTERAAATDAIAEITMILTEFSTQIDLVDTPGQGLEAAVQRFRNNPTKPLMDKIRAMIATVVAEETFRLNERQDTLLGTTSFVSQLTWFVTALVLAIVLAMWIGVHPPDWKSVEAN